jgi:hypothetical protein
MQIFVIKSDVYLLSTTPAKNYAIGDSLVKSLHFFIFYSLVGVYNEMDNNSFKVIGQILEL